jgi:hypothetical protein
VRLIYAALLAAAAVPYLGRWLGAKGNPRAGAWTLAIVTAVVAGGSLWAFVLLGGTLMEDVVGAQYAERFEPVSDPEGLLGIGLLGYALIRLAGGLRARRRMRRALDEVCAVSQSSLVVIAEPEAYAFAVPARPFRGDEPRILVSEGMLRVLDGRQRRVLFAHERAHLRHGHHRFRLLAEVAGAINPLLRPAEDAMVFLCERWADEQAAAEVGDRRLCARSLSAAALATTGGPAGLAAFHEHDVTQRVRALLRPQRGILGLACLVGLVLVIAEVTEDLDATVQLAGFLARFLF